jgi:hypothetical protein
MSISAMKYALDVLDNYVEDPRCETERVAAVHFLEQAIAEAESVKCIVKDCENHKHEGGFVGNLCIPCHEFITTGEGVYSQAYRNTKREWVGLTDEEVEAIYDQEGRADVVLLTQAKLKEKNT